MWARIFLCSLFFGSLCAADYEQAYALVRAHALAWHIPDSFIKKAFADKRTAIDATTLRIFGSRALPESFVGRASRERARRFMHEHARILARVQGHFGVPASLIGAIVWMETNFGSYCGRHDVFNVFYTCLVALEDRRAWAAQELAAYLYYCFITSSDPHGIKGSYSGAFGYGQFMPTSFMAYAVDYDGDGIARHDSWPDVLASIAQYLKRHGFSALERSYEKNSKNWRAIYAYNHSHVYVANVLTLKLQIELLR